MKFDTPLIRGRLIGRYKRFFADVKLEDGAIVTAHCANTGAMTGLTEPGSEVWISRAANPKRKLAWTWEMIRVAGKSGKGLVGVNTMTPNRLVGEAIEAGVIPELLGYASLRHEVPYGDSSRIDILLESEGATPCHVEIKNVHLRRNGAAEFPDSVTSRGRKHLGELAEVVRDGGRAMMFYLVQREDCDSFRLASDIDSSYAEAFVEAREAGVEAIAWACSLSPHEIAVERPLELTL